MADSDKDQNTAPQEMSLDIESREQLSALQFVQTNENPGDLTVILPDDTPDNPDDNPRIVLNDYIALAGAGLPPALTLADGTVIPGEEILALIEGLDYGKVAPAAGRQGGQNSDGGGAGFTAYATEGLGDDLNHGPYDGGYLGPRVEFGDQEPVLPDVEDGSGGGGFIGPSVVYQNNQATFPVMMTFPNHWVPNPFDPNSLPPQDMGGGIHQFWFEANLGPTGSSGQNDDWDGGRVYLQAGETITLTNQTPGGHYWLALDGALPTGTIPQPEGQPQVSSFIWDNVLETDSVGQSLSYTAQGDGWIYFGAGGVVGVTDNVGQGISDISYHDYRTLVTITDAGLGPYNGPPVTSNMLGGTPGDDTIVSGPGNDTLTGDSGADTFQYNSINDGHDTIMDFSTGDGDIINLDALFDDLLGPDVGPREVLVDSDPVSGNDVLTIGDGTGTHTPHASALANGFEITLNGISGMSDSDVADLINITGNIVVDES